MDTRGGPPKAGVMRGLPLAARDGFTREALAGRLTGVIDLGGLSLGDPAADVAPGWSLFGAVGRERYRPALGYDGPTWRRGRGWALTTAVVGLDYYRETAPASTRRELRTLDQVVGSLP